ncbi:alpha/beta hydrolase domain-containing protein [Gemmatimonadota bacterium]
MILTRIPAIRLLYHLILAYLIIICSGCIRQPEIKELPVKLGVTGLEIERRVLLGDGVSFGAAGSYETLAGRVHYTIDPKDPKNARIADIEYAETGTDGLVRFTAEFVIAKPTDPSRGNGALLYTVVNRGGFNARLLDSSPWAGIAAGPCGSGELNGRLMKQGYTLVFSGWQADLLPDTLRLHLFAPEARKDGQPMPGEVLAEFGGVGEKTANLGADGHRAFAVDPLHADKAQLRVHETYADTGIIIEPERWSLARPDTSGQPVPDSVALYFPEGFELFKVYTLRYRTNRSPMMGLCFPAVRDLVSLLRSADLLNPLLGADRKSAIRHTLAYGSSQSGRFLRNLIYQGFNESLGGQRVLDGVFANVPGCRMGFFNYRYAQASRHYGFYPNFDFPFTHGVSKDPVTGRSGGIFQDVGEQLQPKVFCLHHSAEYWTAGAALTHVDVLGEKDIEPPDNVRIYLLSGTAHGYARLVDGHPDQSSDTGPYLPYNPNNSSLIQGPLIEKLARWVRFGEMPPESSYPRLDNNQLVASEFFSYPSVPDVESPLLTGPYPRFDWGPRFASGILDKPLPGIGVLYPVMVPEVDDDGNELAGIKTPWVAVPLASYTGWNYPAQWQGVEKTPLANLSGAWLPFSSDRKERLTRGDSRKSVAERYKRKDIYIERFRSYAESLTARGLMYEEDLEALLEQSSAMFDYVSQAGAWKPQE